jgi:hypothetical protein
MGDDFLRKRLGLQSLRADVNPGFDGHGDATCEQQVAQATKLGA